ncbi:MAG TPA: NAD(P)-dependent alcohol dehydrogenase [Fibrella sp.]
MKAAIINEYGDSDKLQIQDVPKPKIDTHDVLIRVHAAGINPVDTKVRQGAMHKILAILFPKILGAECAGVVEEVGLMITDLQPGDRVVASLGTFGDGYAEYAVAKDKNVVKLPDDIDFIQAAAMPVAAGTALQALRDKGHLRPFDRVLINGASGGVGTFAVQIAKILGAHVTAVCSADSAPMVRHLGADQVIDYHTTDFTKLADDIFEVVFDAVGKSSFDECRNILTAEGTYVTTVPSPKHVLEEVVSAFEKQKSELIMFNFTKEDMNWLLKQVSEGKLVPVIDRTYPLREVSTAHTYCETGHVKGKLVLTI